MAFQQVPNTAEINVNYTQNDEQMQNTFYALFGGTYAQANLAALADAIDLYIASDWLPLQTLDCGYTNTTVIGLHSINDFVAEANLSAGPGEDLARGNPNSVTMAVKKSSPFTGRSARGRIYWMGIPIDKISANENFINLAYAVDVVAAVDGLRAVIEGVFLWEPVLVSRFTGGAKRATGVTFDWIDTSTVNTGVDTQRGRLTR